MTKSKLISYLSGIVLLSFIFLQVIFNLTTFAATQIIGDTSLDSKITSTDVSLIERHILGVTNLSQDAAKNADVNGDGKINSSDISFIERFILGVIVTFPSTINPTISISPTIIPTSNGLYPSYNVNPISPDSTGMGSSATQLASKIKLGWNLGNSLEATGGETAWGNPKTSKALIDLVKNSGFNAIRIPCSFDQYMSNSSKAEIKKEWLDRVKEVVKYCVDNDMYVLLNIHWDGGWLENNCTKEKQVANNAKQKAFWEQISTNLRDFDEHVIFASANEPNVSDATQMEVLKSYHQTFIEAVRSTGGKNSYRVLAIQGPSTDIEKTNKLMTDLPKDTISNKLMVEIHYYSPWNFCGLNEDASWGKMFYYWGKNNHSTTDKDRNPTWGEEDFVDTTLKLMKTQFIDKGIPVIMGEFSATRRLNLTGDSLKLHLNSRAYFSGYVTKMSKTYGILPFYWDNGGIGNDACGIFDRTNNTVSDKLVLDSLINAIK